MQRREDSPGSILMFSDVIISLVKHMIHFDLRESARGIGFRTWISIMANRLEKLDGTQQIIQWQGKVQTEMLKRMQRVAKHGKV